MRPLLIVTMLLVSSTATFGVTTIKIEPPTSGQSERLESYVGKYPSDLLKAEPTIKSRLKTLLRANYSFFMARLQTEMPIENDAGAIVARGCMAHNCGVEEAVLVINLADGKLHCAILSAKFGGKFKVFSEDKAHIPGALTRATQQTD
jgi:hypothetical protein